MDKTQISKLTREQKLLLFDVIQEKKRRQRARKALFQPIAEQALIMADDTYERIVTCGNGFGKTTVAVHEAMWCVQGYHPVKEKFTKVPATVMVVLDKPDKIDQRWIPEINKWFEVDLAKQGKKHGKPFYQEIIFPNGSNILFFFHDQDPMTFESIEGDALIMDEPPPRHCYFGLSRGLRKKGTKPFILLVGTPITGSWIRRELFDPYMKGELEDIKFFKFASDANKTNWPKDYAKRYFGRMTEKEERIRRHGEFFDLDGLALAHLFKRDTHLVEPDDVEWNFESNPCVIAVDPHPSKKHFAVLLGATTDGKLLYLDEYAMKCTATEFADLLYEKGWFDFKVIDIVYDSLGSAENTSGEGFYSFGEQFKKALNKQGLGTARATSFKEKNDEDFIERIRGILSPIDHEPKLKISSHCRGIINDIENVQWTQHKLIDENKPKLDIQNKDYLACLKYALATNLYFEKARKKKIYRLKQLPSSYVGDRAKMTKRPAKMTMDIKKFLR